SENTAKITNPHFKKIYRLYDAETGKAEADYICLHHETIDAAEPLEIFDPVHTWKRRTLENYTARALMVQVFRNGELVYDLPPLSVIRNYCRTEIDSMWDEVLRFDNPHNYYVDLSQALWDLKNDMLSAYSRGSKDNKENQ
ncbi:MAG: nicotinate phosphoribosyltransferase, partial [Clostridia bacterium]|nr:nicotinate phosphoribosyltransferase [Clostridia bacterium]